MIMCIKVHICIWPGVKVSDRRGWICLKFIWYITSNKAQVEFKRYATCQFGLEYLSQVQDVLVLFVFFLMADLP